jgi:hypothetical protein
MNSPSRMNLENNGKIRPRPDEEPPFARAAVVPVCDPDLAVIAATHCCQAVGGAGPWPAF